MPLRDERTWRIVAGSPESLDTEPLVISRYAARDYPLDIVNKRREERRGWSWLSITALEAPRTGRAKAQSASAEQAVAADANEQLHHPRE
jgi:hypothetical protein